MKGKSGLYGYIDVKVQLKKKTTLPKRTALLVLFDTSALERHSPSSGQSQLVFFSQAWRQVGSVLPKYLQ